MLFPKSSPAESSSARVVVTGAGIITALGAGWCANAGGFRRGRLAIRPVSLFDVSRQRVRVAGQVENLEPPPAGRLTQKQVRRLDRATQLLLWAGFEALEQATGPPARRLPIVLGTSSGGMAMGEAYYRHALETPLARRQQPTRSRYYQAQQSGLVLADAFGLEGPVTIVANACASGANAIGHAWDLIRHGAASSAIAGGYDALSQLVFAGFDSLQALSPTQCRPFDAGRDGLALGEGAAVLVLETLEQARSRQAPIRAELVGYGAAHDAHHLTQPHPQGDAAFLSMTEACARAGIGADQVGYLNAHGTGTPLNDSAEAAAINRWAGSDAARIPVSSTKAGIGHLLGAAGAVEAVICLMALEGQWLPPGPTLRSPDPSCRFRLVREPRDAGFEYALTNSFGFGGANASLVFRRWT